MTKEDKELLLRDLYARLPYGFIIHRYSDNCNIVIKSNSINDFAHFLEYSEGEDFKPYLRPMSSMTEEEENKWWEFNNKNTIVETHSYSIDWLNSHHFDYRNLIECGLAIEAPKGMYNIK